MLYLHNIMLGQSWKGWQNQKINKKINIKKRKKILET